MSLQLTPWIRQQFFDGNGRPLAGGYVYFYVAGSTSLYKPTFRDYLGSSANTNPVVLDSTGVAKIFGAGMYDVVIKDSDGVLIEQVLGVDFGGGDSISGSSTIVSNYDALRNLNQDYDVVYALGRSTPFDGGEGIFQFSSQAMADDDGIVLVRGTSSHYYRVLADYIDPRWYGVQYGVSADNTAYLLSSLAGSRQWNLPVNATGSVYLGSKLTVTSGSQLNVTGSLVGPGTPVTVTFKSGSKFDGGKNCLGSGVTPVFEAGVCPALRLSWFTNGTDISRWTKASAASVYTYKLNVDIDTTVGSDISTPANLNVDFIGGSKITISGLANINLATVSYTGVGQIIFYQDISYVGTVKLGTGYTYLEWFGGVANTSSASDNSIPFLAGLRSGNLYLLAASGTFYNVPAGTYTASNSVAIAGLLPVGSGAASVNTAVPSTLRLSGATVTTGDLTISSARVDGSGSIGCAALTLDNAVISDTVAYATGLTAINDTLTIGSQYLVVGSQGKILISGDTSNWVSEFQSSGITFNSVASGNNAYVAVGNAGVVYSSKDGSAWTARTSGTSANLYSIRYVNSKYVAVGAAGTILYSVDGITWNSATGSAGTNDLRDVAWNTTSSCWVVVGASATIYISADLVTWTKKTVSTYAGTFYSVGVSGTLMVICGYNGAIYTSADAQTYTAQITPIVSNLMTIAYYTTTKMWVAGSSLGQIITSKDGVNWKLVNTNVPLTDVIYSQVMLSGQYLFSCGSGYLLTSYDLNTFKLTQPSASSLSNYGITGKPGKVLAVGDSGVVKESTDLQTWTSQTTGTTANLHSALIVNGVYYLLGSAGTYLYSYDGTNWTPASVGASFDLYYMAVNADKNLFVAIGSAGNIYTTTNPIATTPVWTKQTSPVTTDLTRLLYSVNTWYAYGKAGVILSSMNGTTWTNINPIATGAVTNGIVSNGSSITVYFGNNGYIRSTTDGNTYVVRTSGVTANLLSGTFASGKFVICGGQGVILTSTDGITWSQQTSGTSAQLNRIAYLNSKFLTVGSSGTVRQSSDGITWSSAATAFHNTGGGSVTITTGFRGIGYVTGYYYTFGEIGCKICYSSDLSTWIQYDPSNDLTGAASPITVVLNDCYSQGKTGVIFGDGGFIYTFYAAGMQQATAVPVDNQHNWKRVVGSIVIGDTGAAASVKVDTSVPFAAPFVNPLVTGTTDNLIDGTTYGTGTSYTIVSSSNSFTSPNTVVWTQKASVITGDIVSVWQVATTYYLISGGKLYSSADNISFTYIKDTLATNIEYIDSKYYLTGFDSSAIEISTVAPTKTSFVTSVVNSDPYVVKAIGVFKLNGTSLYYYQSTSSILYGGPTAIMLTASGSATVSGSKIDVAINNAKHGTVSNSTLEDIAQVGKCENTTITNFSGNLNDDLSRSCLFTRATIGIAANVSISECSIEELTLDTLLFDVADTVTAITMNNCNTVLTSMLCYSVNTGLSLVINGGFLTAPYSLSNGYAKVYLNSVFDANGNKVNKTSAYGNDGQVFTPYALTGNLDIITIDGWHHPQLANLANGTGAISVSHDIAIASDINSAYTLRYRDVTYLAYGAYETSGITYMGITDPSGLFDLLPQPAGCMGQFYNCKADGIVNWGSLTGQAQVSLGVHKGDLIIATGPKIDSNGHDTSAYELMTNTSPMRNLLLQGGKIVLTLTLPAGYDKEQQKLIKLYPQMHMPNYVTYHQYDISHTGRFAHVWEDRRGNVDASASTVDGSTVITTAYVSYPWTEKTINPPPHTGTSDDGDLYWDIFGDEIKHFPTASVDSKTVYISPIMGISDEFTDYAGYITILSATDCVIPAGSTLKVTIVPCANKQYTDPWMQYWQYRVGNTIYPKGP